MHAVDSTAEHPVLRRDTPDAARRRAPLSLRHALLLDAAASGGMGLLLAAAAAPLAHPLGLPAALLREAGLLLVPFAAALAWLGSRPRPGRGATRAVIAVNAAWVVASLAVAAAVLPRATPLGVLFVLGQAAAVGAFTLLQAAGLREARPRR